MVDEDEVAVAVHPAGVDDLARGRGVDRRSGGDPDIDPGVHPPPAHPEGTYHRPVHRPDEAARRGRRGRRSIRRSRLRGLDLRAEGDAHLLQGLSLAHPLAFARPDALEADALRRPGSEELTATGDELVADSPDLFGPRLDGSCLRGDDAA